MRRLVFPVIAAFGLLMAGPSSAFADDPAPTVSVKATAGKKVCKITDNRLDELSGLVATSNGFVVINDSTDVASHKKVFFLDTGCKVVKERAYSGDGPRDTEDMILSPDGKTLWIADIGDNNFNKDDGTRRDTIGLWTMPADGSKKPKIHRLKYPEGDYHDAEALLLTGGNIPLIVTKEIGKPAAIYQPTGPLQTDNEQGVPLKKVGELTVSATETPGNPYARIGNRTIDGGAIAPGGGKVVLRTYTDALEWDVTGNDVLAALQKKPRTTGLPNETLGEAITYSEDGKSFYTVSDMSGKKGATNNILSYVPATTVAAVKKASASGGGGKAWYSDLTIDQIMYMVGGAGVLGLILVAAGVLGIARHRKRMQNFPPMDLGKVDALPGDPETELIGVGGAGAQRAAGGGVYGGARSGGAGGVYGGGPQHGGQQRGGGGVYGGRPQGGQPRGPVYGPGGGGAPQYGRPPQGGRPQDGQPPRRQGQGGGGGRPQPPPRSQGVYGQPGNRDGGPRPPHRGADGYSNRNTRPDDRFDNPGYRR